ncbi:MAG: hypothetical protein WBB82_17325 [Limnothrix sp.]
MNKSLVILGGAIAGVLILGGGALFAADTWLDQKAETEVETELTKATGVVADVGEADVQLLQKKVVFNNVQLANFAGFSSPKLLTIERVEIDRPALKSQPIQMKSALIQGLQINVDGDMNGVPSSVFSGAMPNLNLMQLMQQTSSQSKTLPKTNNVTANATATENGTKSGFTVDQLTVNDVLIKINLDVPWSTEPLDHQVVIPQLVLTDVTDQNISEKIMTNLGEPVIRDLQAFMLQEVLPGSLQELSKSIPAEIDLSGIELPENLELPDNIQLPKIKLPR